MKIYPNFLFFFPLWIQISFDSKDKQETPSKQLGTEGEFAHTRLIGQMEDDYPADDHGLVSKSHEWWLCGL